MALGGSTQDGEPMAILALELPLQVPFGGRRLSQAEIERVHLEKYRVDALLQSGVLPFDAVAAGPNPPDFLVDTPTGSEGIECAALAFEKRRRAFALFRHFRSRLLADAREA